MDKARVVAPADWEAKLRAYECDMAALRIRCSGADWMSMDADDVENLGYALAVAAMNLRHATEIVGMSRGD